MPVRHCGGGGLIVRAAILGAGPGAQTWAVALSEAGHTVALWCPGWSDNAHLKLRAIREDGIRAVGVLEAHARPDVTTADLSEAVPGADIVVIVTPARAHRPIARAIAPLLRAEQTVLLSPGRTGGAFEVRATLAAAGVTCRAVAEAASQPFTCRLRGPNEVLVADRKREVGVAALPAGVAAALADALRGVVALVPKRSVLETSFENLGPVFHVVGMVLNSAQVERNGLEVYYRDAVTASVARVMEATDAERVRVAAAYGVSVPTAVQLLRSRYEPVAGGLYETITGNAAYMKIGGVDGLRHRYLSDDVPMSVTPFVALAHAAREDVPLHEGLLAIGSILLGEDPGDAGRTLTSMGLAGMDASAIRAAADDPRGHRLQ